MATSDDSNRNTPASNGTSASTLAFNRDLVALNLASDLIRAALPELIAEPDAKRVDAAIHVVALLSYKLADALAAARVRVPSPAAAAPAADGVFGEGPATP